MAQITRTTQGRLGARLIATSHSQKHAGLWQQPACFLHALCGVLALRAPASPVLQKAFPSTWSPISVHIRSKGLQKARHTSQRPTGIIHKARTIPGKSEACCSVCPHMLAILHATFATSSNRIHHASCVEGSGIQSYEQCSVLDDTSSAGHKANDRDW